MAQIVEMIKGNPPETGSGSERVARVGNGFHVVQSNLPGAGLQLTLDAIEHPAYMVNNRFEIEWWNDQANQSLFGGSLSSASEIAERNLFLHLHHAAGLRGVESWSGLLEFHLSIAKKRISRKHLLMLEGDLESEELDRLLRVYEQVEPVQNSAMIRAEVNLAPSGKPERWHNVYASFFREGIFFVFDELDHREENLLTFLSRRDVVIRELLRRRAPYLTPVAVLVADLQSSTKICAELPPEEYFKLINGIWTTMEPKLRRYYATHGKHVGDGMVYYFLPQPDSNHVLNAIRCAFEMKEAMREVSREWQARKNWFNELKLNIGIHAGEEWFGTYHTVTHLEFTVLGDTINQAARLSDFAHDGTVWVSKTVMGKLVAQEMAGIRFGIRRRSVDGQENLVPSTYSRISNLVDLGNPKHEKLNDIAMLPVTEILDVSSK